MSEAAAGMMDYVVERLSENIAEDRIIIIPDRRDQIGYVDTEGCVVYLITVQEAQLVPASSQESRPE